MGILTSKHKQTKKSYLANAIVAFAIDAFLIGCVLFTDVNTKDFLVTAVIIGGMGVYWVYKHKTFDQRKRTIYDDFEF